MKTHTLSFDDNHNIKIDDTYIDIRNDYTVSSLKVDKDAVFILHKNSEVSDNYPNKISLSFSEISEFEVDLELFSSLENGKLHFDELFVVPIEYIDIDLSIKEKPYHSRKINDDMKFVDSEYILEFEKLGLPIYFKISTKNGIDFYLKAKRFEIIWL